MTVQSANIPILEKGLSSLGIPVDSKKVEIVTDLVLTAISLPVNYRTAFPLKYYYTSHFTTVSLETLGQEGVLKKEPAAASATDTFLYHALLYVVGKTFGWTFWLNTDLPMTLLSSPTVVEFICKQPWFQKFKTDVVTQIGPAVLKDALINVVKGQAKAYVERNFIEPLTTIFNQGREETLQHLKTSMTECAQKRVGIVKNVAEEGKGLMDAIRQNGMSWELLERGLDFQKKTMHETQRVVEIPSIRLTPKAPSAPVPFVQKILAAWGVLGSLRPELATLALINPSSNIIELILRAVAVLAAAITGYPFATLFLTECAVKLILGKLKELPFVQKLTHELQNRLSKVNEKIQAAKAEFKQRLLDAGYRLIEIRKIESFCGQLLIALTYASLNIMGHPLATAFSTNSFVQYAGTVGANLGIAQASDFESEQGYLQTLPLQIITGVALTILEIGEGSGTRPLITCAAAFVTMPMISDTIVASRFYHNYVLTPIGKSIIPCYEYVNRASYFYRIGSKINRAIPKLRLLTTPLGKLVSHIFKVVAVAAGGAVLLALRHPLVAQTKQVAIKVLAKGGEIYQKMVISSSVGYYLGGPVGAISNLTGLYKDRLAIPVGMTALATWHLTGNHFVTTLVTVATDAAVRSPLLQEMVNEAKEVVTAASPSIQPIISFLGTVDKVSLLADAVGCAVAMLTLDPVTAAFTSEVVDRTLRLPIVEEVVETGLSTVSQKCTLL
jgi:hypothetical protein